MKDLLDYFKLLVIEAPREFWAEAVEYVRTFMDNHKIKQQIKLARMRTAVDRKHRYIVRTPSGRPISVATSQVENMKRKKLLPKHINCVSIYKHSLEVVKYNPGVSSRKGSGKKIKS
jgi:hypothetical protein